MINTNNFQNLKFDFIPINRKVEYNLGTKLFNEMPIRASVFVSGIDPKKLSVRLKRLSDDGGGINSFTIFKEIGLIEEHPECRCKTCLFIKGINIVGDVGEDGFEVDLKCKRVYGEGYRIYRFK